MSFFLKCEPDGGAIRFYFFSYMNRIGSIVELKIYIRVQEEDIRVQEEFVQNVDVNVAVSEIYKNEEKRAP